jgi:hypothetical protein
MSALYTTYCIYLDKGSATFWQWTACNWGKSRETAVRVAEKRWEQLGSVKWAVLLQVTSTDFMIASHFELKPHSSVHSTSFQVAQVVGSSHRITLSWTTRLVLRRVILHTVLNLLVSDIRRRISRNGLANRSFLSWISSPDPTYRTRTVRHRAVTLLVDCWLFGILSGSTRDFHWCSGHQHAGQSSAVSPPPL